MTRFARLTLPVFLLLAALLTACGGNDVATVARRNVAATVEPKPLPPRWVPPRTTAPTATATNTAAATTAPTTAPTVAPTA